jgi:hypothetical protein
MPSKEKSMGTCEFCSKSPRMRRRVASGEWLCHTCLKMFGRGDKASRGDAPTQKQLDYAQKLGIQIPAHATRRHVSNMITLKKSGYPLSSEVIAELAHEQEDLGLLHEDVMFYVMDMWQQMTGKRPKQVGIPWADQQFFAAMIVVQHRDIARGCVKARQWVEEVKNEKQLEYCERTDDWSADQDQFKPPLPRNETWRFVSTRAKERWKKYLPFLQRWLGGQSLLGFDADEV